MRKDRKEIRKFLIELDIFLEKNEGLLPYGMSPEDIGMFFINELKANSDKRSSLSYSEETLNIPTLVKYSNRYNKQFIKIEDRPKTEIDASNFEKNRTDKFVRSVAYAMDWQYVKDISYDHIFTKRWLQLNMLGDILSEPLSSYPTGFHKHEDALRAHKDMLNEFLIPGSWNHNMDLLIYK